MHQLELPVRLDLGLGNVIEPGTYIADDVVGAQLLLMAGGGRLTPFDSQRALFDSQRALFVRAGGFGDLTLLTPVLRELKHQRPDCHIAVSTMSHYAAVLQGMPYVDEIVPFPVPLDVLNSYDGWVFYENAVERNPRAREIHMTDLFAEIAGVSLDGADKRPDYRLKASEGAWADQQFPRVNGTRRIAIQPGASSPIRKYRTDQMGAVCGELIKRGWEVMLLGVSGDVNLRGKSHPKLTNLCDSGLTFRQSAAVMAGCDVFLGNDSALLHVAGALGLPAVGLYGPFPWKLRTAYCPTTFALEGKGPCAPCHFHSAPNMRQHFPEHCPSKAQGHCQVLTSIAPERVVAKIEQVARTRGEQAGELVEFPRN